MTASLYQCASPAAASGATAGLAAESGAFTARGLAQRRAGNNGERARHEPELSRQALSNKAKGACMRAWTQVLKANSWEEFALAASVALLVFLAAWLARNLAARLLAHQALAADVARATRLWLLAPLALYGGTLLLELPARLERLAEGVA